MSGAWQEFEAESRDSSRRLLVLAAVIAVAVLAALRYFGAEPDESVEAASEPVLLTPTPEVVYNIDQLTSPEEAPPPPVTAQRPQAGNQSYVGVYECLVNGQRVVSDHPCGADAQVRTLVVDRPDPRDVARQQQRTWAAQAGSGPAPRVAAPARSAAPSQVPQVAPVASPNEAACEAIDQAIANLNARMRAGYTSAQGEWLRAEWHDLQKRREELRCGRR
jgi:hypothetical protein